MFSDVPGAVWRALSTWPPLILTATWLGSGSQRHSQGGLKPGLGPSLICLQNPGSPASSPDCKLLGDRTGVSYICIFSAQHRVRHNIFWAYTGYQQITDAQQMNTWKNEWMNKQMTPPPSKRHFPFLWQDSFLTTSPSGELREKCQMYARMSVCQTCLLALGRQYGLWR